MMRFTIIDNRGAVSCAAPGHALKAFAAGCARGAASHEELLRYLADYDKDLATTLSAGLSVFDEHCVASEPASIARWFEEDENRVARPIRVIDNETRRISLEPERLGLVIFNLQERRIVQVQNSYGPLEREDRGRIREAGRPINQFYRYALPNDWALVP